MTFSIVARDPDTGQLGIAVQTCMFAVGGIVPWARAGVGAVATQAITEMAHGPRCLDAMARGSSAADALAEAQAHDVMAMLRQVGVVDAAGLVAERASWAVVLRSFVAKGLLPGPAGVDLDAVLDGR